MGRNLPATTNTSKKPALTSPLQLYLKEVSKYPLLSPEEELELAKKHYDENDVAAAHRLVTSNLRLVVKIANDFKQASVSTLDLIQEGNYGLMQAVKKYNPYKGVKLSSYAAWWIRAYILKYIMDNKSQVKIGTTAAQRKLFFNLRKEAEKLLEEYDKVDTKLLAENLEVREKDVVEMQMRLNSPDLSLDAPVSSDEGSTTHGSLIADQTDDAESVLEDLQLKTLFDGTVKEFEKTLKDRDLEIFKLRILNDKPMTLQEIGDKYNISRERARQLEAKIVRNLKKFVKEQGVIDI